MEFDGYRLRGISYIAGEDGTPVYITTECAYVHNANLPEPTEKKIEFISRLLHEFIVDTARQEMLE